MREYQIVLYESQPVEGKEAKPILTLATDKRSQARAVRELAISNNLFVEITRTAKPKAVRFAGIDAPTPKPKASKPKKIK